jgi:uncharacterized protein YbjT (DUF2867 family)
MMILLAGGTGTLGTKVLSLLLARGDGVRVLTRDAARADELRGRGAEVIVGDIRDLATVRAAVSGCATVISAVHGFVGGRGAGPAAIDRDGNRNLIRAAVEGKVDHTILVSTHDAAPDSPLSLHRMKYAAEQTLLESGLDWTIIRSVPFLETWVGVIGAHLADRGRALVLGRGDNSINFVSVNNVASVIDRAVHDRGFRGRTVDVTGPDNLTFTELARQLIEASGKPGRITHIPLTALRVMSVLARPVAPAFARKAHAAVVMNTTQMAVNVLDSGAAPSSNSPAKSPVTRPRPPD